VVLTALAMNMHRLYPVVERQLAPKAGTEAYFKSYLHPTKWDQPMIRLRGADETAAVVERVRQEMRARTGQEPLLISGRYDTSSSLAFYLPGHPFVYCIMSSVGGRRNQYDFWPGLNARDAGGHLVHAGRPAVIVGSFDRGSVKDVLQAAFDRLEGPERFPLVINGITVKDVVIYRGYGFRELPETGATAY
jgi:undecaprenyl-diphosphatase